MLLHSPTSDAALWPAFWRGHEGSFLPALTTPLRQLQPPASEIAVHPAEEKATFCCS